MEISRRDFFKKVAKILPIIVLSTIPELTIGKSSATGCKGGCVGTCSSSCVDGCSSTCAGTCMYGCKDRCGTACDGMCIGACKSSCKFSCDSISNKTIISIKKDSIK